jgi:hypothetical protein
MSDDNFYRTLAAHIGVWFLEDPTLIIDGDASIDEERGYAPLAANEHGLRWAVAPRGAAIARLIDAAHGPHGRPLFAIAAPSLIRAALDRDLPQFRAHRAAYSAERANPELSARAASGRKILAITIGGNAALFACLFSSLAPVSLVATLAYAIAFFAAVFLRLFACAASFSEEEQAVRIDEAQLPNYSLIVPLYDEASVVPQLTRAIERLDYPRAKLEVKFVVEHHDDQTTQALRTHPPRVPHEIIVAPPGAPLTKPRALNMATPHLRGDIVAVFDAEDLPEYDQLRKPRWPLRKPRRRSLACKPVSQSTITTTAGSPLSTRWITPLCSRSSIEALRRWACLCSWVEPPIIFESRRSVKLGFGTPST